MNANDVKSYFAVRERLKEVVDRDAAYGWSDDAMEIMKVSMCDEGIEITYRTLIDDYNSVWRYKTMRVSVDDFCGV